MASQIVDSIESFRSAFLPDNLRQNPRVVITRSLNLPDDLHSIRISVDGVSVTGANTDSEHRPALRCNAPAWTSIKTKLFEVRGRVQVLFENLKFKGGHHTTDVLERGRQHGGVVASRGANVEVRNCTVTGWPFYGLRANTDSFMNVVNCDIRTCRQNGLGYGVAVYGGSADIEYCVFEQCRHAIAASPAAAGSYTAKNNYILMTEPHHAIDVHGSADRDGIIHLLNFTRTRHDSISSDYDPSRSGGIAGRRFVIEQNTVINESGSPEEAVNIRGQPEDFCVIRNNTFKDCSIKLPKHADRRRFFVYGNKRA